MEKQPRATSADLSVIAHATEDNEKVCLAARNLLPEKLRDKVSWKQEFATGHHGNPIVSLKATISDRSIVEHLIMELASKLSSLDKSLLWGELDHCIDGDGSLYLRFDKQAAYLGEIRFKQVDPIRIRVKFQGRPCTTETIRRVCKEMGLID